MPNFSNASTFQSRREVIFSGRDHQDPYSDLQWSRLKPQGNWAIRITGFVMRKAFRKMCSRITFDQVSFEQAMETLSPDTLVVLSPTHRSLMDFVVCSYLCFEHPELKISIPYIAADLQIGNLPFLGWFLKQTYAFYLKRGRGKADPELNRRIRQLVEDQQTLEMFIEGTRSRARQCLKPKRGLLRALQQTGVSCALLPITINYDRLPEEKALVKELYGGPKPLMRMRSLIKWIGELVRGEIVVGRVHMACGQPVLLDPDSDVHQVSLGVVEQLQKHYVVSTFHLEAFLRHQPELVQDWNLDVATLTRWIEARGGTVIESDLKDFSTVDAVTEWTYRNQWNHWFFGDLKQLFPENSRVSHYLENNCFLNHPLQRPSSEEAPSEALQHMIFTLFEPLNHAYTRLMEVISVEGHIAVSHPKAFVAEHPDCFLPMVEEALAHLLESRVLIKMPEEAGFARGPAWAEAAGQYTKTLKQQASALG